MSPAPRWFYPVVAACLVVGTAAVSLAAWRMATRPHWIVYDRPTTTTPLALLDQRTGVICTARRCVRMVSPALAAHPLDSVPPSRDLTRAP